MVHITNKILRSVLDIAYHDTSDESISRSPFTTVNYFCLSHGDFNLKLS